MRWGGGLGKGGRMLYMLFVWSQGTLAEIFSWNNISLKLNQEYDLDFLYIDKGPGVSHVLWRYDMSSLFRGGKKAKYRKWLH